MLNMEPNAGLDLKTLRKGRKVYDVCIHHYNTTRSLHCHKNPLSPPVYLSLSRVSGNP